MRVGQLCQQGLGPVQIPTADTSPGQSGAGPLAYLGVGTGRPALIEGVNFLCPGIPGPLFFGVRGHQYQPFQQSCQTVRQQVAVGKLPQLVPGQGEGRRQPLRARRLVDPVEEQADLPLRDVLLKGEKGVQIHPQDPGQGGQQRNIRVMDGLFPLVDCRSRYTKPLCQSLLSQSEGLPPRSDHIIEHHISPLLFLFSS